MRVLKYESRYLPQQRKRLESKRKELVEQIGLEIGRLSDQRQLSHPRTWGGPMDDEQYNQVRDLILRIGEHHYQQLVNLDHALIAIDTGTFGICTDCKKLIEADRLIADPTVPRCINCQRNVEKTQDERDATPSL